jgi:hypothetical protein
VPIPHPRLAWTAAAGILAVWFFQHGGPTATNVPAVLGEVLGAALGAYLVWPLFAARLPQSYALVLRPGGGVVAVLVGLVYALAPFASGTSAALSLAEVVGRFVWTALAVIAIGVVLSILGASRTGSRQSGSSRT